MYIYLQEYCNLLLLVRSPSIVKLLNFLKTGNHHWISLPVNRYVPKLNSAHAFMY